jgi:hypothetical protein
MQPPELTDHGALLGSAPRAAAGDTISRRADKTRACTSLKYACPGWAPKPAVSLAQGSVAGAGRYDDLGADASDKYGEIMAVVKEAGTDVQPAPPERHTAALSLQMVGPVID